MTNAATLRTQMKAKATARANQKDEKVDASDWSASDSFQGKNTYPIQPKKRAYKNGGKVKGEKSGPRADKPARKAMGGGMGPGAPALGGMPAGDPRAAAAAMMQNAGTQSGVNPARMSFSGVTKAGLSPMRGLKRGGKAEKCDGGPVRTARKSGGRAKGKTNINIVIAQPPAAGGAPGGPNPAGMLPTPPAIGGQGPIGQPPGGAAPMPMPMPGGMPPMPMPGAGGPPQPRKRGGRTMGGAGSGLGRLQKAEMIPD